MKIWFFVVIISMTIVTSEVKAQCCMGGFDGFSVGYGFEGYSARGFNNYIYTYNQRRVNTLTQKMDDFGSANGFYAGVRLLSFVFLEELYIHSDFYLTFMSEKNQAKAGADTREFKVSYVGKKLGVGVAMPINESILWNLINSHITWTSAKLNNTLSGSSSTSEELSSSESKIGFSAETGVEIYFTDNFVLDAAFGYHIFGVDQMQFSNGKYLSETEVSTKAMKDFIDFGGMYFRAGLILRVDWAEMLGF